MSSTFQLGVVMMLVGALALCDGCARHGTRKTTLDQAPSIIGSATMKPDGTIVLWLRARLDSGAIGDGFLTYAPGDPQYEAVLKHLGGLKPGENKPVPPWPD